MNVQHNSKITQRKKDDDQVAQDDIGWTIEITRRVTSRKSVVSTIQGGFTDASEVQHGGKK